MLGRLGKEHDFVTVARDIVGQAIGSVWTARRCRTRTQAGTPAAVALGRLGGMKGGKARAANLPPARRPAIARKAALERCGRLVEMEGQLERRVAQCLSGFKADSNTETPRH